MVGWIVSHIPDVLAAMFVAAAVAHLAGFGPLGAAYGRTNGILLAIAAGLLVLPATRLFGFGVAAMAMFLSATTLLHRRQYGYALPVIVALFALVPVSVAATAQ